MAKLIVIDGLDGCGKATQTKLLADRLEKEGKRVIRVSFPNYESDSSAAVKMYLNGEIGKDASELNPYMCGSLYAVDRFIQYYSNLKEYFKEDNNTIILCDRYLSANIIHQGGKLRNKKDRESYIRWCYYYECNLCGLPKESLTIVLTVEPSVSQKLLSNRYNNDESKKDIHESNIDYLNKCYDRLMESVEIISENDIANWVHIDCTNGSDINSIESIHKEIYELVKSECGIRN